MTRAKAPDRCHAKRSSHHSQPHGSNPGKANQQSEDRQGKMIDDQNSPPGVSCLQRPATEVLVNQKYASHTRGVRLQRFLNRVVSHISFQRTPCTPCHILPRLSG